MIKPTIGRIVLLRQSTPAPDEQANAAIVTYVYNDRLINIAAFSPSGKSRGIEQVILVQEGDETPETGYYAEWMPYQIGQAKANEAPTPTA